MNPGELPPILLEKAAALEPRRSRGWLVFIVISWALAIALGGVALWRAAL